MALPLLAHHSTQGAAMEAYFLESSNLNAKRAQYFRVTVFPLREP